MTTHSKAAARRRTAPPPRGLSFPFQLGPMFHWAPADRFGSIAQQGLRPNQRPACSVDFHAPYVCFGPDPAAAWELSARVHGQTGQVWHLWQARLDPADEVHILEQWGPAVREVRVIDGIPLSRIWFVGERAV